MTKNTILLIRNIIVVNMLLLLTLNWNATLAAPISTTDVKFKNENSVFSMKGSSSTKTSSALDAQRIFFDEVASGLVNPLFIANAGDGSGRLFIVERSGIVRILKDGLLLSTPFLDITSSVKSTSSEQGLLGLAFHPSYELTGEFFVVYTAPRVGDSAGSNLILERFFVSENDPDQATLVDRDVLLTIEHPMRTNHNGGTIAFGSDGYLYWSTGDGGGGGDPDANAQDLTSLLGKILRLDVDASFPYTIPDTNPFYNDPNPSVRKEVWAYGLRNPWRVSFDRLTYDLYIGDVGQGAWEEIDFQPTASNGGENYGWNIMEGSACYNAGTCDTSGKVFPVAEYSHSLGCSVTGGYVYRGSKFPSLSGYYFYGDYCSGRLFSLTQNAGLWETTQLVDTTYSISTFGEDELGELYLADYSSGKIYSIGYIESMVEMQTNFSSVASYDGWILENGDTNQGGTMNSNSSIIYLGDDAQNRQYRVILHFDTSSLPDDAVIVDAKLRLATNEVVSGTNPFLTHDKIVIELNTGAYSTSSNLQLDDFKLPSDRNGAGAIRGNLVNGFYRGRIKEAGFEYFNLTGATQIRLRFKLDDDDDNIADLLEFYSGNVNMNSEKPRLIVYYYIP